MLLPLNPFWALPSTNCLHVEHRRWVFFSEDPNADASRPLVPAAVAEPDGGFQDEILLLWLEQELAGGGPRTKSRLLPGFAHKTLLVHRQALLHVHMEKSGQRVYGLQSLEYLPSGPLGKRFAEKPSSIVCLVLSMVFGQIPCPQVLVPIHPFEKQGI